MKKIEVELDKYHLVASVLTMADAYSQSEDPEDNKVGELIETNASTLWSELPKDYRHTVELDVLE